jgi:serine/threonine protein kinase
MELAPGTELGKYTIEGLIGGGGFGLVYQATQRGPAGFAQQVALKMVRTNRPEALTSLAWEAQIIARLRHRNIVQIYDFANERELYFLVMELVVGMTLRELCRRREPRRLPLWLKLGLGAEVTTGLQFAHSAVGDDGRPLGLVHRDIKPSNILLSRQGDVKIADFGLAKAARPPAELVTSAGIVKGTLAYMSPEQQRGKPATPASDVFSLGAVLFELCTGVNPTPQLVRGGQPRECLPSVVNAARAEAPVQLLRELGTVLDAALSPEAGLRPSAAELGDELRRFMAQLAPADSLRLNEEVAAQVQAGLDVQPQDSAQSSGTKGLEGDEAWGQAEVIRELDGPTEVAVSDRWAHDELRRQTPATTVHLAEASAVEGEVTSPKPRVALDELSGRSGQRMLIGVAIGGVIVVAGIVALVLVLAGGPTPDPLARGDASASVAVSRPLAADAAADAAVHRVKANVPRQPDSGTPRTGSSTGRTRKPPGKVTKTRDPVHPQQPVHPQSGVGSAKRDGPRSTQGSGWLSVNSQPWAHVYVDGKRVNTTPVSQHPLEAGPHTLLLVGPGRLSVKKSIVIRPEQHLNLGLISLR